MKTIDILLTNAIVLTMDKDFHQYEPGAVAVTGDSIVAVGPAEEIAQTYIAKEIIDCGGKVLMPGLVNAHTHMPMTLLRGLADDLRLDVWLMGYMMPVEREFVSPEFVRLGTQLACIESIRSGVTCLADMYYFEKDVAKATAEAGLRAICSQTVLKFPSPDAQSYEEALEAARVFIQEWKGHPLIVPSVAPHAPYTCTEDILQASAALAAEFDVPLHIHISETAVEVENSQKEHDMSVVSYIKQQNLFDAKVIAAHCVHVDESEMHTLQKHGAGVAHNPTSNLKLGSGVAPVTKMVNLGLAVGIGTDGPASNNNLDMFEEIRLTALLAKGSTGDPTVIPARTALAMATRIGAQALHLGDITGSLEPGKRADMILVEISPLHNAPRFRRDPGGIYAQLVYAAKSTDVSSVMVNGQWLMRDRRLLTLDEEALLGYAHIYAQKIDAFLIKREQSVLSKLVAIGGAMQQESFEVQAKVRIPDPASVIAALQKPDIDILYHRHYHEYDTYFQFEDPQQGQLRYREDEYIDESGQVDNVRYRLTLVGQARERHFPNGVLLSRSRYLAQAVHSLRFYREYFKPSGETFVEKDRLRWRIIFRGTEFYINLDRLDQPKLGTFLEIKSRTWSRQDAENKAGMSEALMEYLGASSDETVTQGYVEFAGG
ncbi:MAG: amidohydrolase family protein [Chloroflexi bacterium]|nr:amidohydrolase family protein [Chloroflexota bacterium]